MKFPTITIPDPVAVGKWLDEQLGTDNGSHRPLFNGVEWMVNHWFKPGDYVFGDGLTPEELLADIRRQLAENDPLAKLRKEWEAMGKPDLNAIGHAPGEKGTANE